MNVIKSKSIMKFAAIALITIISFNLNINTSFGKTSKSANQTEQSDTTKSESSNTNSVISNNTSETQTIDHSKDFTEKAENDSKTYRKVIDWYMNNINYYTITLLMTIESSFIPFPSEVVIPPAAWKAAQDGSLSLILIFVFSTIGALLGALINYYLSISLGRSLIYKFADTKIAHILLINREKIEKAEQYFINYGKSSTFIGRLVPGIRQLISIPAGLSKMNIGAFIGFTALGAGIWNIILIALGYFLFAQQDFLQLVYHKIKVVLWIIGGLFIIYLIINGIIKRRKKA